MACNPSPEVKSILIRTPDLMTALSNEPLGVAGILLSKGLISGEIMSKMLIVSYTPAEKATILIEAVRNRIDIFPAQFSEFLEILSTQICAKEVAERLRSTFQSIRSPIIPHDQKHSMVTDTSDEIDIFESQFSNIQEKILTELVSDKSIDTSRLLNALTSLPLKYRNEYEKTIQSKLPTLSHHQSITELFCVLVNPMVSFLDYGLLDHIIAKFGSASLKQMMQAYGSDMRDFMRRTTLKQLIELNYFPGQAEVPQKFSIFQAKIDRDASECTLEHINVIRRRYCCEVKLSEIIFHLVAVMESNSFIVRWLVPSALVSDIMKSFRNIGPSFYRTNKITSVTLDSMWIFLSQIESDKMWSRVRMNDVKFKDQFHTMYKQIVYELKMQEESKQKLSLYLMEQHPKLQKQVSDCLSRTFLKQKFPESLVDFRILATIIERFGSICLNNVMRSYCRRLSVFLNQATAHKLIKFSAVQSKLSEYLVLKCRISEEPSRYRLQKLLSIQTKFCTTANINEVCFVMDEVNTDMRGSFTIKWYVLSSQVSDMMKFAKFIDQGFYQDLKITSLTLDGMWLFLDEAEIDAMWSQASINNTKLVNILDTMYKQIVHEIEVCEISQHELSSYLSSHYPEVENHMIVRLSEAFLNREFPLSLVDFRILHIVIQKFGSECLNGVMNCYCEFVSKYYITAQQLIGISPVHPKLSKDFTIAKCKIMEKPSEYGLQTLLSFQTRFCVILNLSKVHFVMSEIDMELNRSFTVTWLVPSPLVSYIAKCAKDIKQSIYQEYKISSFTLDTMWLFINELEINTMWICVNISDTKFADLFHAMYKQIVHELQLEKISQKELSLYLVNLEPPVQECISDCLSKAFLNQSFPLSLVDFGILSSIIEKFGSECLKRVMNSYYSNIMIVCAKHLTALQFMNLAPAQFKPSKEFVIAKCTVLEEPSNYRMDRLLNFQNKFCTILNVNKISFIMGEISKKTRSSFSVNWCVPSGLVLELLISANQIIQTELFKEESVASIHIGNWWLYNCQITPFGNRLKQHYQQSQGLPSPVEWIPSPTRKIFRLAMIEREKVQQGYIEDTFIRMTISGRVDDILFTKSPVELENIFRNALNGREVILIEGAPGSGKSTLSVHICRRWSKGELFQQFTIVILVQLRDPAVQRAQTIADLLPVENDAIAQELATELIATNGRGVLWVLDGWDELPIKFQQESIFRRLLPPKPNEERLKNIKEDPFYANYVAEGCTMDELWKIYLKNNPLSDRLLTECSVIVTSRPVSSGDLHTVVSSRIEVLGFTSEEQRQYFTECLKGDTKALEALLEKIQENPVVQSICYLPLNAAFIVHTFKYRDQSIPNTEYEIYLSVILSCIQRHYDREGRGHVLPRKLASLDDLSRSKAVKEPFQCLCELAYCGVMENKVTFSSSDLPQGSNTLSLLQAIESFLESGKSVFYNFLHLSIQEILTSYYITFLSDSEQVSQFQKLFDQPRFTAVLQFFAAITKLENPGIRQVIARIVKSKSTPLLLSLLRCLHEAQDPSLCIYVAESLNYKLYLGYSSLSPLDCLCISYFLLSVGDVKDISVDLTRCYIDHLCVKCLTKYLCNNADYVSRLTMNLEHNQVNKESASQIAKLVYVTENLYISYNQIEDTGLAFISEAVRETIALKTLILYKCGITSSGAEDLSRAVAQNRSLEKLDIGDNSIGDEGINYMAEALKQNAHLKELWIVNCGITDKGAASLASALTINNSLKMLHMGGSFKSAVTEDGLSTITQSLVFNPEFVKLVVSPQFDYTAGCLRWKINEMREKNKLPPIEIEASTFVSNTVPSQF